MYNLYKIIINVHAIYLFGFIKLNSNILKSKTLQMFGTVLHKYTVFFLTNRH